jgi:hypothetical protein
MESLLFTGKKKKTTPELKSIQVTTVQCLVVIRRASMLQCRQCTFREGHSSHVSPVSPPLDTHKLKTFTSNKCLSITRFRFRFRLPPSPVSPSTAAAGIEDDR